MKNYIFIILTCLSTPLFTQNTSTVLDGKLIIGDDASIPVKGAMRFNQALDIFQGYNGTRWVSLSPQCSCPFVLTPFSDNREPVGQSSMDLPVSITINFSHSMDSTTFIYTSTLRVLGTTSASAGADLFWSDNYTTLRIETHEKHVDLVDQCEDDVIVIINGNAPNGVKGNNGEFLDGERDGCCQGKYSQVFYYRSCPTES